MLTTEDFEKMSAKQTLDTIAAYSLLNDFDQVRPEEYADTLVLAAEHLNTLRNQRWSEWAESKGIL